MSRAELVSAYSSGRIGRREFIKGMMAVGASLTAATAFADKLRAAPSQGAAGRSATRFVGDIYDDIYDGVVDDVTDLPATGVGPVASEGARIFGPLAVAASAAAAGIALRFRRMRGGSSEEGAE